MQFFKKLLRLPTLNLPLIYSVTNADDVTCILNTLLTGILFSCISKS